MAEEEAKQHGRSQSFQDKTDMIDNLPDSFGIEEDDISLSGDDDTRGMNPDNDNEPTPPPEQIDSGSNSNGKKENESKSNDKSSDNLAAPPAYDVGPQAMRESQIHKAMGTATGGSLLTPAQIASESIKAEGKTAKDEFQDLASLFHSSQAQSSDLQNEDLSAVKDEIKMTDLNKVESIVNVEKDETPPAYDPSNPKDAIKEAAAMEQTLLMAQKAKGNHVLLPSEGNNLMSGSEEEQKEFLKEKEKQRVKAQEMANAKRAKEEREKEMREMKESKENDNNEKEKNVKIQINDGKKHESQPTSEINRDERMTSHISKGYGKEPPTYGKVLLHTSVGDVDVELWPKQAPLAVRNFVQLCMEGYYDDTIFHRVIANFMAQGGDPTGTGTGGESIYGKPFKDEFHSRLTFSHRGILAMANSGDKNDNGSQFFITLDKCDWLNRKHTIFGKVTGHTLYNVLKFNQIATDKDTDRPTIDQKILKCEILLNPFDDIVPRTLKKESDKKCQLDKKSEKLKKKEAKRKSRVNKKNSKLLSFDDDEEENTRRQKQRKSIKKKINIEKRSNEEMHNDNEKEKEKEMIRQRLLNVVSSHELGTENRKIDNNNDNGNKETLTDAQFDKLMAQEAIGKHLKNRQRNEIDNMDEPPRKKQKTDKTEKRERKHKFQDKKEIAKQREIEIEKEFMKKIINDENNGNKENDSDDMDDSGNEMSLLDEMKEKYLQQSRMLKGKQRQNETLSQLNNFINFFKEKKNDTNDKKNDNGKNNNNDIDAKTGIEWKEKMDEIDNSDDSLDDWMCGKLAFNKRPQDYDIFNSDDYVTVHPKQDISNSKSRHPSRSHS